VGRDLEEVRYAGEGILGYGDYPILECWYSAVESKESVDLPLLSNRGAQFADDRCK
jgi:hypothetical protein